MFISSCIDSISEGRVRYLWLLISLSHFQTMVYSAFFHRTTSPLSQSIFEFMRDISSMNCHIGGLIDITEQFSNLLTKMSSFIILWLLLCRVSSWLRRFHKFLSRVAVRNFYPFPKFPAPVPPSIQTSFSGKWLATFPYLSCQQHAQWELIFPRSSSSLHAMNRAMSSWFWF